VTFGGVSRASVAAALLATAAPAAARAQEAWVGLFGHDVPVGIADCCFEHGADVQAGLRSGPLVSVPPYGELRLYALGSANTSGGVPFAAAGAAWRWPIGASGFYLQPGLGAAVQFGSDAKFQLRPDRLYLGSRVLFEPELSLGWHAGRRWTLEASYLHLSHAQLAGRQNPGLDDVGVRAVYAFGR
jgi:hypothetical protein